MTAADPGDTAIDPNAPEARFAEVADDGLSRAQQALGLIPRDGGFGIGRRIALVVAIAWLPLVVWALWQRRLLPGSVPEPLLQHFGIHARFLVALPMLLVAEATTRNAFRAALPQFLSRGLVAEADVPAFRAILERASRLRGSRKVMIGMLALAMLASLAGWIESAEVHELVWASAPGEPGFHFGVFWFSMVSRPLFLLALAAWAWRLGVIGWAFARIARLDLRLVATHPDRVGGLGFLERLPGGLAPLFFAVSVPIAAHWGHDAAYHGLDVNSLRAAAAILVLLNVIVAVAPMLAFASNLRALRRRALTGWGNLLAERGRRVERRWIDREPVEDDPLLSAPELGPVADTAALFETVHGIRPAPIARSSLIPPVLATVIPLIPVVAIQIPLKEIAKKLLTALVGV
jgi:hypothetical protein